VRDRLGLISRALTGRPANEKEAASTFLRFFGSKHIHDLRLICYGALLIFGLAIIMLVLHAGYHYYEMRSSLSFGDFLLSYVPKVAFTYLGPITLVCATTVSWAYQTASKRLGVVDLFACEISTLCRVGTIFLAGDTFVEWYEHPPTKYDGNGKEKGVSKTFISKESYFPVFEGNAAELEILEASVVKNITEFYTYMKATRDALRKLDTIELPRGATNRQSRLAQLDPWHTALSNVIYALFLAYESGRKAIHDLIEYEPPAAENEIVILITELRCYAFLVEHFAKEKDDSRHMRLMLRAPCYGAEVSALLQTVAKGTPEEDWRPAKAVAPELQRRRNEALKQIKRAESDSNAP
jgi:hypothetical protein